MLLGYPLCVKEVVEGKNGWSCSGYKDGCKFIVWKEVAGHRLTIAQVKELIGKGRTEVIIIEATKKELLRLKQRRALQAAAGIFKAEEYPEFAAADASAWVRNLRDETDRRRRGIFGE